MNIPLPCCQRHTYKYWRILILVAFIGLISQHTYATCSAAWTYTIHGDSVFLRSADTSTANHHFWSFDGTYSTSNQTALTHVYTGPGTYHICQYVYTVGGGCSDSLCQDITIQSTSPCHLNTAWTYTIHGDSVYLTSSDTSTVNHHYWTASSSTVIANGLTAIYVFPNYGTYRICLHEYTPGTSCADSFCQNVTISAPCNITASWQSYSVGDTTHFYAGGNTTGVSYSWNFGDGHSGTGSAPLRVYAQVGTYNVCLYAYTGTNCIDTFCQNITITATAPCHISASWTSVAHGDTVYFYASDTNSATHHFWNFGDGSAIGTGSQAIHIYANAGTYHVCFYDYIPNTACTDSFCQNVTVTVRACHVSAAWTYTIHGDSVFLHTADTSSANNHYWTFGGTTYASGTSVVHIYPNYGVYRICLHVYTPGTTCIDSSCNSITIAAPCSLTSAWTYTNHSGDTIHFYASDTASAIHHYWTYGDGTQSGTAGNPVAATHVYTQPGTYHVCLHEYIPGSACADSFCSTITVGTPCHITASWQAGVHGDTVHFYGIDTNTAAHHYWNYGDGTTSTSGAVNTIHTYSQPGTYHVCFYVYLPNTACVDSFCNTVTIAGGCHISAAWTYTLHGDTILLHSVDTLSANHHYWVFDGNTSTITSGTSVTHVYTGSGTHHICLYVYTPGTSCSDSSCNNITIANTCNVHAAWQSYTVRDSVHFYNANNDSTVHLDWNFGDGSFGFGTNPWHGYATPGTYHVCCYAYTAGCIDSFCNTVIIGTGCHVSAAWTYTTHGDTVFLHSVDTASANNHYWIFGSNTSTYVSGTSVTHVYTGPGTYHICLYVYTPGTTCSDSSCNNITIASTTCHVNAAWTSHDHGDTLFFSAADTASATYLDWNFGDGSYGFGQYPTHVYSQPGTYHVCLYAYTGTNCIDSFCNTITVSGGCHVSAAWTYTLHGDTVILHSVDTLSANHHYWVFGGNTSTYVSGTSVTHVYTGPGTYHICLYVYTPGTSCIDSSCNNITIVNPCNVNAAWQSYTRGDTAHFYAGGNTGNVSYSWNFGDGHNGTGNNPIHIYAQPGTYHVCLYAYTGTNCIDSFCNTITVAGGCSITTAWTYFAYGDSVHFTGADTNRAAHHYWSFGDGSTGSGYDISHVYSAPGVYHVCYYVYIPGTNCIDSSCNTVIVAGSCSISAALHFANVSNDTIAFYALFTDSAANYTWIYGDGTSSTGSYAVHGYPVPGTYHVCLHVFIPGTPCSDSVCIDVNVGASCAVTAAWASITRTNDSVQFYAADPDPNAIHSWTFGDGTTASGSYAAHTFPASGTYHVCLFVSVPNTTCSDSLCKDINTVLGIGDLGGAYPTISLRPNPFTQYTIMNIDGPASTYEVRIYDMVGQQVRTAVAVNNSIMIDRGDLSSGIYMYAVMAGNTLIGKGKMSIE